MKFKVGDRVRIKSAVTNLFIGKEGVIWEISKGNWSAASIAFGVPPDAIAYRVEVDGIGRDHPDGNSFIAFQGHRLEPIVNPDETAWTEFKRYLQPDPAVILSKEPA